MSRVGLADNAHSARQGVAGHGSGCPVVSPRAADIVRANLRNECGLGLFASIPAQVAGAIRDQAQGADRVARFAAERGTTGFEWPHLSCLDEAIPTLSTNTIED